MSEKNPTVTRKNDSNPAPGDVVSGLVSSELVEIQRVEPFSGKTLVTVVGLQSSRIEERLLSDGEFATLDIVRGKQRTFNGDAGLFLLGVEAERIRIAHRFDPLFAVNSSIVDPLPHQVEAVYRYLLPLPKIRFLLADDTGAGKTIMTGLLIKELRSRGMLQKVLIITPGGLTKQWKEEELQEKFGLYARLVNRATFDAEPGQFSRYEEDIFITSIDFLVRNKDCLKTVSTIKWDLVVVDEAHKLSAYEYGTKPDENKRYKAVKELAHGTYHLLFLTATPHRGRKDTFRRLLLLLDEYLFQKDEQVAGLVREQTAPYGASGKVKNQFFLRRLKEEMVDWDNQALFRDRRTKTVGYDLTPEEKELYNKVTSYVRSKRRVAKKKRNRNVELALMVMQRRLASSLYAIKRTLENRLRALNEVLSTLRNPSLSEAEKKRQLRGTPDLRDPLDITKYEEETEEERERIDQRIFRQVLTDDPKKVEEERDEVKGLFQLADGLKNHNEAKFAQLLVVLDHSDVIRAEDEKLLIFTENLDTLNSLAKRLKNMGYTVATIHGGMDVDSRKQAQRKFRTSAKIMVATDAAGEGINLQFCRYLINWDIPWNPSRLEQRMGRIHRYGQANDVWVYNLVAQNTREGSVLQKVLLKLDIMRDQMGSDRVYDVIDEWLEGVPLVQLIENAIDSDDESAGAQKIDDALTKASNERAEELTDYQKKPSVVSLRDLSSARELRDESDEHRLQPLFIQRFFERAWTDCGGTIHKDNHYQVWHIGSTPTALLELARERRQSLADKYDTPFVFDKKLVSVASEESVPERTKLMGPGHPVFDTLIEWAIRESRQAFAKGATLVDPNISKPQRVCLVRSTIDDGRREWQQDRRKPLPQKQLAVVVQDHMGLRTISPSYMLNCIAPETAVPNAPRASFNPGSTECERITPIG